MGSWVFDVASGAFRASPEFVRIAGVNPDDVRLDERIFRDMVHPDDRQLVDARVDRARSEMTDLVHDYRIVHPGGELRHVHSVSHPVFDHAGNLVQYIGTIMDVTDQTRSGTLLAGEKHLLEMIARGDSLAAILDALCRLVEELAAGSLASMLLLDPNTRCLRHGAAPTLPPPYNAAIDGLAIGPAAGSCGTAAYRAEPVIVPDVGTDPLWTDYRDLALSHGLRACWSTPILSSEGGVLGTFAIYYREPRSPNALDHNLIEQVTHLASIAIERDQADRVLREAEAALRQAQADLAHVSRVTTMGELTVSLAHEVNQPIAAALTNANTCLLWLAGEKPNIEEARAAARRIVQDGTRASEIISRIRLLFRKETPQREWVDVNELIREMLVLLRNELLRDGISVRTALAADLRQVMGDRVQLQQVLLNLIVNSSEAMREVDGDRELTITSRREDADRVLVSVSDTGVGLPSQPADQIFKAFFTTKALGTGMGLSISRSIVESHGGRLWAADNAPCGASFHLTLPIDLDAPA
jgi:PAS domain S-box-containing protein